MADIESIYWPNCRWLANEPEVDARSILGERRAEHSAEWHMKTRKNPKPALRSSLKYCCSILLVLPVLRFEGTAQEADARRHREVTIPNTELRTIRSQIVGQEFTISVQLPPGYGSDTAASYPALYVTDANRAFPMVANISSVLAFPRGNFPEIIVVGIGYPILDMADWAAWRTRDLTPTSDTSIDKYWNRRLAGMNGRRFDVRSGGASKFLEFIIHELIPFVESNYRVSHSDRGLAGYSYGGLFALYALFAHPETFGRVFAGSPSVEYDNEIIFKQASGFAATGKRLETRVFLSAGSLEDSLTVTGLERMSTVLRSLPGTQVSSWVFSGEDHRSCMAAAIMRALRVLYGP